MKKKIIGLAIMGIAAHFSIAQAADVIPITAEEAFDSTVQQVDPLTGEMHVVALVDVRTAAESYWVGSPAKVDLIVTVDGEEIIPLNGKVQQKKGSNWLTYQREGRFHPCPGHINVSEIADYQTSLLSVTIPYETWDDATGTKPVNTNFVTSMETLAEQGIDTVILMCRSGKRSSKAAALLPESLFDAVYEIDQPDGKNGRGGFQGTSYDDHYNGYRGYPGRNTKSEEHPSVSWQDAGLPMHIGWSPYQ